MDAIQIQNLTKTYPKFKLHAASITLPMGYIMGLIGENGAGKSTLIKTMLDFSYPDAGSITLLGKDSHQEAVCLKEDIGIVLDTISLPRLYTAKDCNRIFRNLYANWDEALYASYLERFQLPDHKMWKTFSLGMQKKLGIAIALSHHPKLLILDEVTAGLDPIVRDDFLNLLQEFVSDGAHSVLISSHILSDLEKICDYITFLHKGQLLFSMEKEQLMETYGIIRCSLDDAEALPEACICAKRTSAYGAEVLVKRQHAPNWVPVEEVSMEDLMVLLVKYAE